MAKIIYHPHSYIAYQYFIERDGTIHQGRMDNEEGAHCRGQNKMSIGICLMGNFEETLPTKEQLKSLEELLIKKQKEYNIPKNQIFGHQNFTATLCPGKNLYSWFLKYKNEISKE